MRRISHDSGLACALADAEGVELGEAEGGVRRVERLMEGGGRGGGGRGEDTEECTIGDSEMIAQVASSLDRGSHPPPPPPLLLPPRHLSPRGLRSSAFFPAHI